MPIIFQKDGYQFFFYSNDHEPIHVHVRKGGGEAVFNIQDEIELRESQGLKIRELSKAQELAEEHKLLILQKWHEPLIDKAVSASFADGFIVIQLQSDSEIRFPVANNRRLKNGTPDQLNHMEISPFGIHWPDLDEDLSFRGLLEGNYGQSPKI